MNRRDVLVRAADHFDACASALWAAARQLELRAARASVAGKRAALAVEARGLQASAGCSGGSSVLRYLEARGPARETVAEAARMRRQLRGIVGRLAALDARVARAEARKAVAS